MDKIQAKKLKREHKKNVERKIQEEIAAKRRAEMIEKEANNRIKEIKLNEEAKQQNEIMEQLYANPGNFNPADFQKEGPIVINCLADRNGCGYFRCIWPFELLATYKNITPLNTFMYHLEPGLLARTHTLRFQRQATTQQLQAWNNYLALRHKYNFRYKMQYEIDDLLMEIDPANKIAYDFFNIDNRKENHIQMLKTADSITFSTEALKNIYVNDYGIQANKIKVIRNNLPQFLYSLPYRNEPRKFNDTDKKPRVFWSGSASHLGPDSDLSFILPMIMKTVDEYRWVFQGVLPNELVEFVKQGKIEFIPWVPTYGLANMQFYKARPDICIAPIKPSRFNTCKSDLKYLENCALGAPSITTSFLSKGLKSPYDVVGAEICLDPDPDVWKSMIDHLVKNPDYYMEVVKSQYKVLNGRWMENNLNDWMGVLQ
jgi:hypothetical protein